MSLTNAPAIVTSLSTQLAACSSWVGTNTNHWYPSAPDGTTPPFAVLDVQDRQRHIYAADATPNFTGTLMISIFDSNANRDIGELEAFGDTIMSQLLAQVSGIAFKSGEVGLVQDYQPAVAAKEGTGALRSITITLPFGLEP